MPDDAEILSLIRRAISDPGAHAERQALHEGWAGPEWESISQWGARAVVAALEKAGLVIVPEVIEWGVRVTDAAGDVHEYEQQDEATARAAVAAEHPRWDPRLLRRTAGRPAGPWNEEAPDA